MSDEDDTKIVRTKDGREIEITPEMMRAGARALWASGVVEGELDSDEILAADIFEAMCRMMVWPSPPGVGRNSASS